MTISTNYVSRPLCYRKHICNIGLLLLGWIMRYVLNLLSGLCLPLDVIYKTLFEKILVWIYCRSITIQNIGLKKLWKLKLQKSYHSNAFMFFSIFSIILSISNKHVKERDPSKMAKSARICGQTCTNDDKCRYGKGNMVYSKLYTHGPVKELKGNISSCTTWSYS